MSATPSKSAPPLLVRRGPEPWPVEAGANELVVILRGALRSSVLFTTNDSIVATAATVEVSNDDTTDDDKARQWGPSQALTDLAALNAGEPQWVRIGSTDDWIYAVKFTITVTNPGTVMVTARGGE